tara:strand:+ start:797 stop:952 length:156 start_codon:yes stop_codon:yes gene_type:complete
MVASNKAINGLPIFFPLEEIELLESFYSVVLPNTPHIQEAAQACNVPGLTQ